MPMVKMRDGSSGFVRVLGRGPAVILLHGFAMDSRHWLPLIAPYLNSYQFIMPDFRGHGRSELGTWLSSEVLETFCSDIDAVLNHLAIDRAMLVAYSLGALVGLEYVLRRQHLRIERYLHIELSPRFHSCEDWPFGFSGEMIDQAKALVDLWQHRSIDQQSAAAASASYRELMHEMIRQAFPQSWIKQVVDALPSKWLDPVLPNPDFTYEFFCFLLECDFDVRHRIGELQIPGLIMSGRHSRFFPWQASEWMHQQWARSEHLIFDHSGHGLMFSEPLKFQKAFQFFLADEIDRVHEIRSRFKWPRLTAAS